MKPTKKEIQDAIAAPLFKTISELLASIQMVREAQTAIAGENEYLTKYPSRLISEAGHDAELLTRLGSIERRAELAYHSLLHHILEVMDICGEPDTRDKARAGVAVVEAQRAIECARALIQTIKYIRIEKSRPYPKDISMENVIEAKNDTGGCASFNVVVRAGAFVSLLADAIYTCIMGHAEVRRTVASRIVDSFYELREMALKEPTIPMSVIEGTPQNT